MARVEGYLRSGYQRAYLAYASSKSRHACGERAAGRHPKNLDPSMHEDSGSGVTFSALPVEQSVG